MEEIRTIINGHRQLKKGSGTTWWFWCETCEIPLQHGPYSGDDATYREYFEHFSNPPNQQSGARAPEEESKGG